jgi:hypothetical protein
MMVLRESGRINSLRVWQAAQAALKGKEVPKVAAPEPKGSTLAVVHTGLGTTGVPRAGGSVLANPEMTPSRSVVEPPPPSVTSNPIVPRPTGAVPSPLDSKATDRVPRPKQMPFGSELPEHAIETIQVLLRTERWMELRRLMKRMEELRCPCEIANLRRALRSKPLSQHASLHPTVDDDHSETAQIVLWNEAVH